MQITIVLGSVRKGRQSHKVAWYLKKRLGDRGVKTVVLDLVRTPLPIFGTSPEPVDSRYISKLLGESDGLLLLTPEYHGSFSGVLKNALDYFQAEFQKKPVGVVTVSTGKFGGINASTQLQHVILSMGAYPLPLKLLVPEVHRVLDGSFEPQSTSLVKATEKFIEELLWFADAIYQKKEQERDNRVGAI